MGRLAVILGSNALGPGGEEIAAAAAEHGAAIVQRHASTEGLYVLPHAIDHEANLRPLLEQGCDRVLAIGSVGSLSPELPVGSLLCPDDFIALHLGYSVFGDQRAHTAPAFDARWRAEVIAAWGAGGETPRDGGVYWQAIGPRFETPAEIRLMAAHADVVGMTVAGESIFADARAHSAPGFDSRWRGEVLDAWAAGAQAPHDGGVYWQALGPRFETAAEIRLIASHADVIGMTIASECIVAGELGLEYAALCVVDNLANGLGSGELDVAALEDDRLANATRLRDGLAAVLPRLGAVGR